MNANNLFRFCIRSFRAIPCTIRLRRCYSVQSKEMDLLQHLKTKIKFSGPITVSEYMRMVLTNPLSGYYMQKDVFGAKGDFITSPEISQMFGELLAIWCIHEWMAFGSPPEVKLIELGPGRGTLADDMLRTFSQLKKKGVSANFSLHLVEISPHMRKLQESKLLGIPLEMVQTPQIVNSDATSKQGRLHSETKTTKYGTPVTWYYDMRTVPKGFSFFIAHEFFDALPVHQFQKTEKGWREVLVEIDEPSDGLKFVLSPIPTPAQKVFIEGKKLEHSNRDYIEICPEAGVIVHDIAARVKAYGGGALIADYGHVGEKGNTFRAFKNHQLHNPLVEPGSADLTADVDFSYLKQMVKGMVDVHGPVTQERFLTAMGIGERLKNLVNNNPKQRKDLLSGYDMLINPKKMGERFKFMAMVPKSGNSDDVPAGFNWGKS